MSAILASPLSMQIDENLSAAVREGLSSTPKRLPAWLFYDEAGSRLFEAITERPEYYLTRTERGILTAHAAEIIARASWPASTGTRLRIAELGAGSADKTRLLLRAALDRQAAVVYEPVDVSATALEAARVRIESEIPGVIVTPRVADYTRSNELALLAASEDERVLVLYIGSSIGNFEPRAALQILRRLRAGLRAGDGLLLGVDLVKAESVMLAAYDDAAGVTAEFNLNMLARLNRELGADFYLEAFEHLAVWNQAESRMEMHLVSRMEQRALVTALDMEVGMAEGESIHTENSYKYAPGQAEALMAEAGFATAGAWTDELGWFGVYLGRAE